MGSQMQPFTTVEQRGIAAGLSGRASPLVAGHVRGAPMSEGGGQPQPRVYSRSAPGGVPPAPFSMQQATQGFGRTAEPHPGAASATGLHPQSQSQIPIPVPASHTPAVTINPELFSLLSRHLPNRDVEMFSTGSSLQGQHQGQHAHHQPVPQQGGSHYQQGPHQHRAQINLRGSKAPKSGAAVSSEGGGASSSRRATGSHAPHASNVREHQPHGAPPARRTTTETLALHPPAHQPSSVHRQVTEAVQQVMQLPAHHLMHSVSEGGDITAGTAIRGHVQRNPKLLPNPVDAARALSQQRAAAAAAIAAEQRAQAHARAEAAAKQEKIRAEALAKQLADQSKAQQEGQAMVIEVEDPPPPAIKPPSKRRSSSAGKQHTTSAGGQPPSTVTDQESGGHKEGRQAAAKASVAASIQAELDSRADGGGSGSGNAAKPKGAREYAKPWQKNMAPPGYGQAPLRPIASSSDVGNGAALSLLPETSSVVLDPGPQAPAVAAAVMPVSPGPRIRPALDPETRRAVQEYMKSKAARQEAERKAALESEQAKKMAPLVLRHQQAEAAREAARRHAAVMADKVHNSKPRKAWVDPAPLDPEEQAQLRSMAAGKSASLTAARLRQRNLGYDSGDQPDFDAVSLAAQPNLTSRGIAREAAGARMRILSASPARAARMAAAAMGSENWDPAGDDAQVIRVRDPERPAGKARPASAPRPQANQTHLQAAALRAVAAGVSPSRLHDPRFGQALIRRLAVTNFDQQTRDMLQRQLQAQQRAARREARQASLAQRTQTAADAARLFPDAPAVQHGASVAGTSKRVRKKKRTRAKSPGVARPQQQQQQAEAAKIAAVMRTAQETAQLKEMTAMVLEEVALLQNRLNALNGQEQPGPASQAGVQPVGGHAHGAVVGIAALPTGRPQAAAMSQPQPGYTGPATAAVPGHILLQPHAPAWQAGPQTAWGEPVVGVPAAWPPAGVPATVAQLQANLLASPDNRQLHKKQRTSMEGLPPAVAGRQQQQQQYPQQPHTAPVHHPPRPSNIPAIRIPTEPGDAAAAVPSHAGHRPVMPDPSAPMPVHHAGPTEGYIDGSDGESDILIMEQGARQRSRHGVGDSDDEAQQRITLSGGMNDALEGLTRFQEGSSATSSSASSSPARPRVFDINDLQEVVMGDITQEAQAEGSQAASAELVFPGHSEGVTSRHSDATQPSNRVFNSRSSSAGGSGSAGGASAAAASQQPQQYQQLQQPQGIPDLRGSLPLARPPSNQSSPLSDDDLSAGARARALGHGYVYRPPEVRNPMGPWQYNSSRQQGDGSREGARAALGLLDGSPLSGADSELGSEQRGAPECAEVVSNIEAAAGSPLRIRPAKRALILAAERDTRQQVIHNAWHHAEEDEEGGSRSGSESEASSFSLDHVGAGAVSRGVISIAAARLIRAPSATIQLPLPPPQSARQDAGVQAFAEPPAGGVDASKPRVPLIQAIQEAAALSQQQARPRLAVQLPQSSQPAGYAAAESMAMSLPPFVILPLGSQPVNPMQPQLQPQLYAAADRHGPSAPLPNGQHNLTGGMYQESELLEDGHANGYQRPPVVPDVLPVGAGTSERPRLSPVELQYQLVENLRRLDEVQTMELEAASIAHARALAIAQQEQARQAGAVDAALAAHEQQVAALKTAAAQEARTQAIVTSTADALRKESAAALREQHTEALSVLREQHTQGLAHLSAVATAFAQQLKANHVAHAEVQTLPPPPPPQPPAVVELGIQAEPSHGYLVQAEVQTSRELHQHPAGAPEYAHQLDPQARRLTAGTASTLADSGSAGYSDDFASVPPSTHAVTETQTVSLDVSAAEQQRRRTAGTVGRSTEVEEEEEEGGYTQDMETVMETKSISSMRTSAAGSAPRTSVSASALTSDAQQALITSLRGQQPSTEPVTASLEVERLATAATAHVHAASPVQTIPRLGLAGDHFSQSPFSGVRASPAAGLDASTADLMDLLCQHMAQAQQELRDLEGQRAALLAEAEAQMAQSSAALAATSDERRRQELQKAEFMLTMQVNMALGKLEGQIKLIRDNMVMWGVQVQQAQALAARVGTTLTPPRQELGREVPQVTPTRSAAPRPVQPAARPARRTTQSSIPKESTSQQGRGSQASGTEVEDDVYTEDFTNTVTQDLSQGAQQRGRAHHRSTATASITDDIAEEDEGTDAATSRGGARHSMSSVPDEEMEDVDRAKPTDAKRPPPPSSGRPQQPPRPAAPAAHSSEQLSSSVSSELSAQREALAAQVAAKQREIAQMQRQQARAQKEQEVAMLQKQLAELDQQLRLAQEQAQQPPLATAAGAQRARQAAAAQASVSEDISEQVENSILTATQAGSGTISTEAASVPGESTRSVSSSIGTEGRFSESIDDEEEEQDVQQRQHKQSQQHQVQARQGVTFAASRQPAGAVVSSSGEDSVDVEQRQLEQLAAQVEATRRQAAHAKAAAQRRALEQQLAAAQAELRTAQTVSQRPAPYQPLPSVPATATAAGGRPPLAPPRAAGVSRGAARSVAAESVAYSDEFDATAASTSIATEDADDVVSSQGHSGHVGEVASTSMGSWRAGGVASGSIRTGSGRTSGGLGYSGSVVTEAAPARSGSVATEDVEESEESGGITARGGLASLMEIGDLQDQLIDVPQEVSAPGSHRGSSHSSPAASEARTEHIPRGPHGESESDDERSGSPAASEARTEAPRGTGLLEDAEMSDMLSGSIEDEEEDMAATAVGKHTSTSDADADEVMSAEIEYSDGAGGRSSRTASVATSRRSSASSGGRLGGVLLDIDDLQSIDETLAAPASTVAARTPTTASHVSGVAPGDSGSPEYSSLSSVTDATSMPAAPSHSHSHTSVAEEEESEGHSLRDSAVNSRLPAASVVESVEGSTVRSVTSAAPRQGGTSVASHPVAGRQSREEEEEEDQDGYSVEFEEGVQEDGATVEIEDEDTPQPLSPAQASTHASASLVEETLASSRQPPAAGTPATSAELPEQRLSASGSVVQPQPAVASSTAAGTAASVQPLVQHVGEREEMLMDASDLLSSLIDEEALVAAEQPSASGFTPTALAGAARGPASASAASSRSYTADFGDSREVSLQSAHATHAQPVAQQPPASHSLAEAEVSSVSGDIEVEEELEAEMASPLSSSASHPVAGGVKEDSQPAVQPQAALSVQSAPVEVATQPASTAGPAGTASSRGSSSSAELEAYESSQGGSQPPGAGGEGSDDDLEGVQAAFNLTAGDEEDGSEGGEGLQRSALSDEDLEQYKVVEQAEEEEAEQAPVPAAPSAAPSALKEPCPEASEIEEVEESLEEPVSGEEDAPPFIRGGLATTTINEPGARGAAAASIPELGREASARSLGLERSAGSATGVDGGVVPTSLSHKRLHEEVVEEVEDEGMDSAEDFPQGATTSDSPFTAASRSLPPNAATSQSANQQQEEGATAAMGVTPTSAAAAAIEKNTAGEEQAEEEASSAGSCAPPGTKTSSGLLVDEYSMSFDGGDLELEGEIDVGGDIEVDASPLTTPRGTHTRDATAPVAASPSRKDLVDAFAEAEVEKALRESVEVMVGVAGGSDAIPTTTAAAIAASPSRKSPPGAATAATASSPESPTRSTSATQAAKGRAGSKLQDPYLSAAGGSSSSASSTSSSDESGPHYSQEDLGWGDDEAYSGDLNLRFSASAYVSPERDQQLLRQEAEAAAAPAVNMSPESVRSYVAGVMQTWLAENPAPPQFLSAGQDPLTLEAFLAMERNLADVTDAQHIVNKLLYDAANEALVNVYRSANRIKDPRLFRANILVRPLPAVNDIVAEVQKQVVSWTSTKARDKADLEKLLVIEAAEEERSWSAGAAESEAAVRSALVAALWDDLLEDTARVVTEMEHSIISRRLLREDVTGLARLGEGSTASGRLGGMASSGRLGLGRLPV